jgi:hypothetical protein
MLVLLVFDLLECRPKGFSSIPLLAFGSLSDQLPVEVVFRFCKGNALRGHELCRIFGTILQGHLHGTYQCLTDVTDYRATRRFSVRVEAERFEHRPLQERTSQALITLVDIE